MGKGKGHSSRNLTPQIEAPVPASGSSHRPRGRVRRFLQKVKEGANKLRPTQGVKVEALTRSAVQDAQQAAKRMLPLSGPATTAMSVGQDVQAELDTADTFQDTYLKPLRTFDDIIAKIADVWTLLSVGTELI
ncbi:hypothetical protein BDR07DRAFT_1376893 [Suillus spraguei]|nr:hypothetical protein BDR07DRAFT_1376893 [Suillus spraguei]